MTVKAATALLKQHNLTLRKTDGEYRVALKGNAASAYFTDDLQDAVGTGLAMARFAAGHVNPFSTVTA